MPGLGGGGLADLRDPVLVKADNSIIPAGWAGDPINPVQGIGGFRNLTFYVVVTAPALLPAQAQVRLLWYWDETPGTPYVAQRRTVGALQNDELLLPSVAAGAIGRFAIAAINPGGALAVQLQVQDALGNGGFLGYRLSAAS